MKDRFEVQPVLPAYEILLRSSTLQTQGFQIHSQDISTLERNIRFKYVKGSSASKREETQFIHKFYLQLTGLSTIRVSSLFIF